MPTVIASSPGRSKDRQYVTALARGLKILRCFSHERPQLSVQEIVRLTALPQPTVWRLCHTLSREGFIVPAAESGKLAPGLPVLGLGYAVLVRQALPTVALPYMQALTARHRVGVSLAVRDGLEMLYLQRTHGEFIYLNDPVGARRPLATAPTGWACVAAYDPKQRRSLLEALRRGDPKAWPVTRAHLERASEEYRRQGFITNLGVMHDQMNSVAAPIRSARTGAVYGLSASGLASQWPRKKLLSVGAELVALAKDLAAAVAD